MEAVSKKNRGRFNGVDLFTFALLMNNNFQALLASGSHPALITCLNPVKSKSLWFCFKLTFTSCIALNKWITHHAVHMWVLLIYTHSDTWPSPHVTRFTEQDRHWAWPSSNHDRSRKALSHHHFWGWMLNAYTLWARRCEFQLVRSGFGMNLWHNRIPKALTTRMSLCMDSEILYLFFTNATEVKCSV